MRFALVVLRRRSSFNVSSIFGPGVFNSETGESNFCRAVVVLAAPSSEERSLSLKISCLSALERFKDFCIRIKDYSCIITRAAQHLECTKDELPPS